MGWVDADVLMSAHTDHVVECDAEIHKRFERQRDDEKADIPHSNRRDKELIFTYECTICGSTGRSCVPNKFICSERCRYLHHHGVQHQGKWITKQEMIVWYRKKEGLSVSAISKKMGYKTTQRVSGILRKAGCIV